MSVSNNIKRIRTENHILQRDLANAIQVDRQTVSRYETGRIEPSLEIALRLAAFFKVNMDELFQLEEPPVTMDTGKQKT